MNLRTSAPSIALALAFLFGLGTPAHAQEGGMAPPPPASQLVTLVSQKPEPKGDLIEVELDLRVLDDWHINANKPNEDFLVPTALNVPKLSGVTVESIRYPNPKSVKLSFSETPLAVYEEEFEIAVLFRIAPGTAAQKVNATLRFQACNDQICLPPAAVPIAIALPAGAGGDAKTATVEQAPVATADTAVTAAPTPEPATATDADSAALASGAIQNTPPPGGGASAAGTNLVTRWFDERGSLLAFLFIFLMGLALNLTPCVYPMMGVTVSLFGATTGGGGSAQAGRVNALPRAIVYVLGIAIMYSTLGVVAALTGGLFGGWLANPIVLAGIGLLLLAMALSMFGVYELQVPGTLVAKLGGAAGASTFGTFLAGLLVGVFAAPCIGPPIIALLAHVGAKGDPVFGFWAFFVLSLGLGLPYLVLGASSGLLTRMPRSGSWRDWVKHAFGVILLGVAAFYLCLAFAPSKLGWIVPLALLIGGVYLGFLEPTGRDKPVFRRFKWAVGTFAIVGAALIAFRPTSPGVTWQAYSPAVVEQAKADGKLVLLDFGADWCVPCHELAEVTFTDAAVVRETEDFVRLKVDLSRFDSPEAQVIRERFDVAGVPTIVFLGPDGAEIASERVVGFLGPKPFLERVRAVRAVSNFAGR